MQTPEEKRAKELSSYLKSYKKGDVKSPSLSSLQDKYFVPKDKPVLTAKEYVSESAENIANKLNTLTEAIDPKVIKGIPTKEEMLKYIKELKGNDRIDISNIRNGPLNMSDQRWHGGGLQNITGLITAGTNVTITGTGTDSDPYIINSSGGGGGNQTLAQTLAFGNVTGGLDIVVSTGDIIIGQSDLQMSAAGGNNYYFAGSSYLFQQWDGGGGNTDFLLQGGGTQLFSHTSIDIQSDSGVYGFYEGTAFTGTLDFSNLTGNVTFTLPDQAGTIAATPDPNADTIYMWDDTDGLPVNAVIGTGLSYDHSTHTLISTGGITGSGTDNHIVRWDISNNIQNSDVIIADATAGSILVTSVGDNTLDFVNNGDGYGFSMTASNGTTSGSSGGNLVFTAGNGSGIGNSAGGTVDINTGDAASGNATGGHFDITTGNGFGSFAGGRFQLVLGHGGATGAGGAITIQAGAGGATSGAGGQLQLLAGNATAGNSNGGNLILYAGIKSGGGTNGTIQLAGGGSASNALLDISLISGGNKTYTFPNTSGTLMLIPAVPATYTISNVTTTRTYDADSVTIDELADTLGTLVDDLRNIGLLQ